MRYLLAASLSLIAWLTSSVAAAAALSLEVQLLDLSTSQPTVDALVNGSLDHKFFPAQRTVDAREYWLRIRPSVDFQPAGVPTLNVRKGRHVALELYVRGERGGAPLGVAAEIPAFIGAQDVVFILPDGLDATEAVYARVRTPVPAEMQFSAATLSETLAAAGDNARMITLAFGALMAMAIAALLTWFVLSDRLLVLYASLFSLQALYVAYLSGQGFDWPVLSLALPVMPYTWNVTAALSGAVACLFVREIAELQRLSRRIYRLFGWFAAIFVVLAVANVADHIGWGWLVAAIGNLVFVITAATTLVAAFVAWRRDNRAAGWFLIAWVLLEAFTITSAVHLLVSDVESVGLLYYGLPLSMVAAAVLIALGVADRLRDQRLALTDAERRAQSDPLTGVLNRRSLLERLDSACLRARARGLPIALLFIDVDHFKQINDTHGHQAGDACLKAIIGPIQAELRHSDTVGRYGGEEFVVILSSADIAAAQPIAERIRQRVADIRVAGFGDPIHLTCSIGVASSDMLGVWGEHLIARADQAVYAAKRSGRNCVQVASPLTA